MTAARLATPSLPPGNLEGIIEEFKYDGGLVLAEDYMVLEQKMKQWLREFDMEGKRRAT